MEKTREKSKRHFVRLLFIISLASCSILMPFLITNDPYSATVFSISLSKPLPKPRAILSSPAKETYLNCDRNAFSSDVCVLRGDIRTNPSLSSIFLYSSKAPVTEKIRPYTRKWETSIMDKIKELDLVAVNRSADDGHRCDVIHRVPAVIFSGGGYIGNVYHDFRDCMVPLFITSSRFNRRVVFVVVQSQPWWRNKYGEILSRLTDYPLVDFSRDNRTHCFPEATVGLHVHGELAVDPARTTPKNTTINDFQGILDLAYGSPQRKPASSAEKPKLAIIFRKGSRSVENEAEVVRLAEAVGFRVEVLRPNATMALVDIYRSLNSADALTGVVGCALTHLLFMRPGSVFIQIKPLGTEWAAEANYGEPAKAIGLKYIPYLIQPKESSLSRVYKKDDPVLTNPESISKQGWAITKKVFLDKQMVRIDLRRFKKRLTAAYEHIIARKKAQDQALLRSES
ncbi:xylan glycosyltransferase MUCI21-like [Wolffia australiana]